MFRLDEPQIVVVEGDVVALLRSIAADRTYRMGFRGHASATWRLEPSFSRFYGSTFGPDVKDQARFRSTLTKLKKVFEEGIVLNGDVTGDQVQATDIWEYGQHFGLPTPLLDWTYSPYVAAFFAVRDPCPAQDGRRAIWTLNLDLLNTVNHLMENARERYERSFSKEMMAEQLECIVTQGTPSSFNKRLAYQQGFFTRHGYYRTFETWLNRAASEIKQNAWNVPILRKLEFVLSEKQRSDVLAELDLMNVNSRVPFPGIQGSVDYALERVRHDDRPSRINLEGEIAGD
jgi:hypothetical protein